MQQKQCLLCTQESFPDNQEVKQMIFLFYTGSHLHFNVVRSDVSFHKDLHENSLKLLYSSTQHTDKVHDVDMVTSTSLER